MTEPRVYHVGIVVPALEPAMAQLSAATGITWAPQQRDVPILYDTPDGPRTWHATFVYSKEPPYIELLEQLPDSIWAELGMHHLGMWSDDVDADSAELEASGCTWQAAMSDGSGARLGGCYHLLDAAACRIELASVERARPRLERYLSGRDYL
jgi:hypothetical protein